MNTVLKRQAFTLVELLVVISIIGLLSAIATVSMNSARVNARNQKRKADLVQISKALELYYTHYGTYPSTGVSGCCSWWGATSTFGSHASSGSGGWIPDLAPTYIGQLPNDPNMGKVNPSSALFGCRSNAGWNTYVYTSNGTDYKLLAYCGPEGTLAANDPFYDPTHTNSGWTIFTPAASSWY
jgi:prepilin-type N-terminal cleavage/methylation domain-containing protein